MVTDAFRHLCFSTSLFILALKPEPYRPSDAWSGRFFRCLRMSEARPSLEITAQGVADGLGEGFGLSFLFGSFSLDSKEKEQSRYMILIPADQASPWIATHTFDLSIHRFPNMGDKMYPHILATNQKSTDCLYYL